jgi:hypothetical protein
VSSIPERAFPERAFPDQAFFRQCIDNVDRVTFTFADGREFQGWAVEVEEDRVLVSWSPNPIYAQAHGGQWSPDDE